MDIVVPILVTSRRRGTEKVAHYSIRPVFMSGPVHEDYRLNRATQKFVAALRKQLGEEVKKGKLERVAKFAFAPQMELSQQKVEVDLAGGSFRNTVPIISFRALDRRVAFCPNADSIWFEVPRGESLKVRTQAVLEKYLRGLEKQGDSGAWALSKLASEGKLWLSTVEFDLETQPKLKKASVDLFASLFSGDVSDGATELNRTGRCLDLMYPEDLDRAVERDDEALSLDRYLSDDERRPVLITGPRGVGKTALLHEVVYQRVEAKRSQFMNRKNVWLLSPQRLISGMSYVGQWENRLLAILREAELKEHVLYFDDLVGLFHAGVSRDSDLCVANVLKPWIEGRRVRVVGEITPQALRVLRELDRGFADLFHFIPLSEPDPDTNLRIQLATLRRLEQQFSMTFGLDVLPTVMDLARRHTQDVVLPGAAATMMHRLANRFSHQQLNRHQVLQDFQQQSGLQLSFLDGETKLEREMIVGGIREMMVGQPEAVEAATDAIGIARARLNDPERPLGCFLFLGPTGVGKTQCAKAICRYLYSSEDRLIRFDMNEYTSAAAVSRLVGTRGNPEGLLTTAVRRQPFSVILLDEIEKADPDVFDLLLQVMGEGRLTDALGRTADFTNTIVILTSNLGARQAAMHFGFGSRSDGKHQTYLAAAERFFRPEFLNRIDRLIPFDALTKDEVRLIARDTIQTVCDREGFSDRNCILIPDDAVVDRVVQIGFDDRYGARGVRRAIEQDLLRPVAAELARRPPSNPTVVELYESDGSLEIDLTELEEAKRLTGILADANPTDVGETLPMLRAALERMREQLSNHRPEGDLVSGQIRPEQYLHIDLSERLTALLDEVAGFEAKQGSEQLHDRIGSSPSALASVSITRTRQGRMRVSNRPDGPNMAKDIMTEMHSTDDIHDYIDTVSTEAEIDEPLERIRELVRRTTILHHRMPSETGWEHAKIVLLFRVLQRNRVNERLADAILARSHFLSSPTDDEDAEPESLFDGHLIGGYPRRRYHDIPEYSQAFEDRLKGEGIMLAVLEGNRVGQFFAGEIGTHLAEERSQTRIIGQLTMLHVPDGQSVERVVGGFLDELDEWRRNRLEHLVEEKDDPLPIGPIIRKYQPVQIVDVQTGVIEPANHMAPIMMEPFVYGRLPLPPELLPLAKPDDAESAVEANP